MAGLEPALRQAASHELVEEGCLRDEKAYSARRKRKACLAPEHHVYLSTDLLLYWPARNVGHSKYGHSKYGHSKYGHSKYGHSKYGHGRYGHSK